ncbi:Eco57I restriction-modification methylase domain-containing protein [Streptomyces sp. NPDC059637]|uniref:Eco57I restriction-modification methylase domain-containing protein n=1 Tax=Streptomyces sp. NPDC059637 TaxID=3347752 RepID=UPI00369EC870
MSPRPAGSRSTAAPRGASSSRGMAAARAKALDGRAQHQEWLDLVEVSGPFLTMPVLRRAWPQLDALDKEQRTRLRARHADWQADPAAARDDWAAYVLRDLLEWRDALALRRGEDDDLLLDRFTVDVPEHDTRLRADFALVEPGTDPAAEPDTAAAAKHIRVLGTLLPAGTAPTARDDRHATWSATPADRLARLLRHHDVPLGIVTDGRWWCLVWAPVGGVTTTAVFDTAGWNEASERTVVRAWISLLRRSRFFEYEEADTLLGLLKKSLEAGEEVTDALGVQVRQAVELLVDAIGRADARAVEHGAEGLHARGVPASEVYRGAVAVMMRVVFLLFAEERGLLPADNEVYATSYSAGRLCAELEARAQADGEGSLEHTTAAWHRLIALFHAVHAGVDHPELHLPAYDGSIFDPQRYAWLESTSPLLPVDDRTVLHMLQAVQYVQIGTGKNRERRRLTFRALDVEQIGYVYEGLLSYDGRRAVDTVVGLIGPVGKEHEVPLRDLEAIAAASKDVKTLAKKVSEAYKEPKPGIGTPAKLEKLLAPLAGEEKEEARRLLLAASRDRDLAERLLPFFGILRRDLRDLPVVIRAGALYVTESALRKNTGTHYTPRFLAEEIVHHALEPLVYEPGPLQTADTEQWRLKSAEDILALKVADIAMGSAAFLVAACRYLGDRLIEAWEKEGREAAVRYRTGRAVDAVTAVDAEQDPVVIEARRQVIEHCLYGVDINPMAVEMAKLSLWLVSMDPTRPFTFLDDRLVAGDSLLGITSMEQIETLHLDPSKGREDIFGWIEGARGRVQGVAAERAAITAIEGRDIAALEQKRQRLRAAEQHTERLRLIGDLISGAALATCASGRVPWYEPESGERMRNLFPKAEQIAGRIGPDDVADDSDAVREARALADEWLASELPDDALDRRPVHWPLVFPEVFLDRGGFDAIVGNPPFLGGHALTGSLGENFREYLVDYVAYGKRGSADLVTYFELRAHELLHRCGQTGLIATGGIAQGVNRRVGLDQIIRAGVEVRRAISSAFWPTKSASLKYCAVWSSKARLKNDAVRILNGATVSKGITTSLNPVTREMSWVESLEGNSGGQSEGSKVYGLGFTLSRGEAREWISGDGRYAEILFPYVNGQDVNNNPDHGTDRWVINFHDWQKDKAAAYPKAYEKLEREVKLERESLKVNSSARERWWLYERSRIQLYKQLKNLERCIVLARSSELVIPVAVSARQVFSDKVIIFACDDFALLAQLSSSLHYWWAIDRGITQSKVPNYTPTDVFETLVSPPFNYELRIVGARLDDFRRGLMRRRGIGLNATYNLFHDPVCEDEDIVELRRIHEEIDRATVAAYGWHDLLDPTGATPPADPTHETFPLDHGFHETDQGTRYTIGLLARTEIIDRLRQLNHQAYADEVFLGLHKKPKKHPDMPPPSPEAVRRKAEGKGGSTGAGQSPDGGFPDDGLFPPEDALF